MTGAGLGWLQGTLGQVDPAWVVALLSDAVNEMPAMRAGGNRWYSESMTVGPHVMAAWAPRTRPEAVETYFEVRQPALDRLGGVASLALAAELVESGARMTRADGYYDDPAGMRNRPRSPTHSGGA
jgi:hypothetical protein